jgi:radical SAM protein with 4Fe4S-binding SPASM domain
LGEHPEILTGDSFFALTPGERRTQGLTRCGAAKMTCAVAPDGSVYPCAFLSDRAFLAGNVRTVPLSRIFQESPVFRRFRQIEPAACRDCDRFPVCHGGCPAVAYFLTRTTSAPDPECLRAVQEEPARIADDTTAEGPAHAASQEVL